MSASAEKNRERGRRPQTALECKPLLEAATKDLFRRNAFRITGLPVDATTREVGRFADKLKLLAEVGQDTHAQSSAFPMKPPPSLDEIREAFQKLKDPEKRLIDEFFWFWPEEFGSSQSDPAMQALAKGDGQAAVKIWAARESDGADGVVAKHNLALVYHVCALDWDNYAVENKLDGERRQKVTAYWKDAFSRWEKLATNEAFWEKVTDRIRQLNEPNLPTGFARRMRATLPEALDKINAELAVAFAEAGQIELTRLHIQFMRQTHQGLDNVDKTAEMVLTPARNRLKEHIRAARERADKNPLDAANAARELLGHAQQTLCLFDLFFEKNSEIRGDLFDEVASLCNQLPVAYHKATGDDETCLEILRAVLPFATSIELRQQIEQNISTLSGNVAYRKLAPIYELLKALQDSKALPASRLASFQGEVEPAIGEAAANFSGVWSPSSTPPRLPGFSPSTHGSLSAASPELAQLFDSAAIVLRDISLAAWNNHHDLKTAVAANELALNYAASAELHQRLAADKAALQGLHALNGLAPISAAPTLSTLNGIGFTLYGCTDVDAATGSYLTTYYFVFLWIPIFPICRYRVARTGDSYRFFGKAPLRPFDKWHLAIAIGLILLFIILGSSSGSTSTSSSPTNNTLGSSHPAPSYAPPQGSESANYGGNAYRVPKSLADSLSAERTELESERTHLEALDAQIQELGAQIDRERLYVDRASQYSVDAFNAKVSRYNALVERAKTANAAFNQKVEEYNAKLERYGR